MDPMSAPPTGPDAENGDGAGGLRLPDEAVVCPVKARPTMAFSVSHGVRVVRAEPSLRVS